jgi:hypothetical protein
MNAELQELEARNAVLRAVAHSLTEPERARFLAHVAEQWPRLRGADVADVLDITTDHDMFLSRTEPFFERFGEQLPQDVRLSAAIHAVIILGEELTPARVIARLQRAGVTEAPRYPEVEVGLLGRDPGRSPNYDVNHLMLRARAEQGMRAAGVPEDVITEFRASVRHHDDQPGFSRNAADIARWVTFADRWTPLPGKIYDPLADLAVILTYADATDGPKGSEEFQQALANLRSHLDMRAPQTIAAGLAAFFGRTPE